MNTYATTFIPNWQIQVNDVSQNIVRVPLPGTELRDRQHYIHAFSGTDVFHAPKSSINKDLTLQITNLVEYTTLVKRLNLLISALGEERAARLANAQSWNRYEVPVSIYPLKAQSTEEIDRQIAFYQCSISGIQEFEPPVAIGDRAELRQLILTHKTFDSYVYCVEVYAVRRAQGIVIFRSAQIHLHSCVFNICFAYDESIIHRQIESMEHLLSSAPVRQMTFAES